MQKSIGKKLFNDPFMRGGVFCSFGSVILSFHRSRIFFYNFLEMYTSFIQIVHIDPDQTPRSVTPDLGLHCMLMSFNWTFGINGLKLHKRIFCDPQQKLLLVSLFLPHLALWFGCEMGLKIF